MPSSSDALVDLDVSFDIGRITDDESLGSQNTDAFLARGARSLVSESDSEEEQQQVLDAVPVTEAKPEVKNWEKFTVKVLKEELKSRHLKQSGRKADLVTRLEENDRNKLDVISVGSDADFHDETMLGGGSHSGEVPAVVVVNNTDTASSDGVIQTDNDGLSAVDSAAQPIPEFMRVFDDEAEEHVIGGFMEQKTNAERAWKPLTQEDVKELLSGPMLSEPAPAPMPAPTPAPAIAIAPPHDAIPRILHVLRFYQPNNNLFLAADQLVWKSYHQQNKQDPFELALRALHRLMGPAVFMDVYHRAMCLQVQSVNGLVC